MRDRLLTQHFLQRFLENDLLSPEADRHDAIAMVCGGLLTLGLFLSILISMKFVFMPFQSPGRTALLALGDRLTFVSIAMIVMALVAILVWDALSLDPRDTATFGLLPIGRGVIVRAKLRAVGILAGGFALAVSSLSSLFHPVLVVAKLPIGLMSVLALVVIHLTVTLAAGLCAFATIMMVRELLRALLGERFSRVSATLQAVLIVAVVTGFLLLPALLNRARPDGGTATMLPPLWFVGLHEVLAGDLVASLPRGELPRRLVVEEDRAAGRYRSLSTTVRPLAWRAVGALVGTLLVATTAFFWNCRRLPLPLVGRRGGGYRGPAFPMRVLTATLVRSPATQAGFFFTLACVFRSGPHRAVLAGCTAVSIALATVLLAAGTRSLAGGLQSVPLSALVTQTVALSVLLFGFRHVTRLPADTRANRLFRMAWIADSSRFLAGVRRGGFVAIVLPAVLLLLPPHLYLLGARLGLMHAVSGLLLGAALISLITSRVSLLPFVASYAPAHDLNTVGPVVLVGGLIAMSVMARVERFALEDLTYTVIFWGVLAIPLLVSVGLGRNTALDLPSAFDVPPSGATRLDLD